MTARPAATFQDMLIALERFWHERGCVIEQPYASEVGAGRFNPATFLRALELGRPMLRATNTGISSSIGHDGRELARLPWFTTGVLEVTVTGRTGETPYLQTGDWPALVLSLLLIAGGVLRARR